MDIIEIISAVLALIFSIISFFIALNASKKDSINSLQSRYYEKIFDDYLINKLPKARELITFNNGEMIGAEDLIDELDAMKSSSLYFKYNNAEFYDQLTSAIDNTTKYISESCNSNPIDQDRQSEIIKKTKELITDIYQIIFNSATS